MATKRLVLEVLEQNRDKRVSGERIAELLDISRNMVWRAIKDLRSEGYRIEAATNKGYRLTADNDMISAEGIKPFLVCDDPSVNIKVYREINSTNREAKARAIDGAAHGTVIIADGQTSGKGRYSRDFYSPSGSGLYMSFILRSNDIGFANPTAITAYAALCVCEAIESVCGLKPSIKWVNDVFLNGKKVGGILTEATTDFESRSIGEIILGIGINVSTKPMDFPEAIRARAGSLYPDGAPAVTRNRLAAEIINRVLLSDAPKETELFARYKERLFMLGTDIAVIQGKEMYAAKAVDIDERGRLIVQMADGSRKTLISGEISV